MILTGDENVKVSLLPWNEKHLGSFHGLGTCRFLVLCCDHQIGLDSANFRCSKIHFVIWSLRVSDGCLLTALLSGAYFGAASKTTGHIKGLPSNPSLVGLHATVHMFRRRLEASFATLVILH